VVAVCCVSQTAESDRILACIDLARVRYTDFESLMGLHVDHVRHCAWTGRRDQACAKQRQHDRCASSCNAQVSNVSDTYDDAPGGPFEFSIELDKRVYLMKSKTLADAKRWVQVLSQFDRFGILFPLPHWGVGVARRNSQGLNDIKRRSVNRRPNSSRSGSGAGTGAGSGAGAGAGAGSSDASSPSKNGASSSRSPTKPEAMQMEKVGVSWSFAVWVCTLVAVCVALAHSPSTCSQQADVQKPSDRAKQRCFCCGC